MSSRATSPFRPRLVPRLVLAAAVLVGSAGCAADPADSGAAVGAGSSVTTAASTEPAPSIEPGVSTEPGSGVTPAPTDPGVTTAPGRAVPLVGGGTLDISTLADKPLALWFWAPG